jgi:hypothetical protein
MPRSVRIPWLLIATISFLLTAIVLRIAAAFQPLWLDEIWSLMFAERTEHWWQVFTIHHLNNHPLNTLYLWFLGREQFPILYRIPSLLSGITLLLWMSCDAWKRSRIEAFFTVLFIGFSLPIVQSSTEARGYGPMLLAAYAAYFVFCRMEQSGKRKHIVLYTIVASLAVVLHLSAVTVLLAAAASTFVRTYGRGFITAFRITLRRHAVPLLVFGALVIFTLHHQAFDVGQDPGVSFGTFGAHVLGWPALPLFVATGISLVALVILIAALEHQLWSNPQQGVFLLVLLLLAPALLIFVGSRAIGLEVRFFLPGVVAFFVLLSVGCARALSHRSSFIRGVVVLTAAMIITGHLQRIGGFLKYGRGESKSFSTVIAFMKERSPSYPITFGTEFSIDNVLVEYYGNTLGQPPAFVFVRQGDWERTPPQWLLERRFAWEGVQKDFLERASQHYEIVRPSEEGKWWVVWRKQNLQEER